MDFLYKETDVRPDIRQSISLFSASGKQIVTRFPPEPSGYLHIGHVKAIYINYGLSKLYNGKFLVRFDDTNPEKETMEYETSILEDLNSLGVDTTFVSRTSDYFEQILECGRQLILSGDAYVDDTEPELMAKERSARTESKNRNNSVERNMELWLIMNSTQSKLETDNKLCLRLKLNMNDNNGCMRDPVLCRIVDKEHQHTKDKFRVYPTYDFACPIVDCLEGVTHVLRSTEFNDRDDQYKAILLKLKLDCPELFHYGKVELADSDMSKRKIKAMIDEKKVIGWHDPRLVTIRGILNNGLSVEGLKEFAKSTGFSKNIISMSWDKIWGINRKIIDPMATRIICMNADYNELVRLEVIQQETEEIQIPAYSKNPALGSCITYRTKYIIISKDEYDLVENGEEITLINWGNMIINKDTNQLTKHLEGDFKKTKNKIMWLTEDSNLLTMIELRKYIIPIADKEYTSEYMYTGRYVDLIPDGSYIQVFKGGYYKKINNVFVWTNDGKK